MRLRKHEREAIIALLDQEWDDVDELAKTLFTDVCGMLLAREWHVIIGGGDGWVSVFGPFENANVARKHVDETQVREGRLMIRRVLTGISDMGDSDDV